MSTLEKSEQFKTASTFSLYIEKLAKQKRMPYLDAVLEYCEKNFIDPQDVANLINKSLRDRIETELRESNVLPKQAKLDV